MKQRVQTASHWGVYNVIKDEGGRILTAEPSSRDPNPTEMRHGLPQLVRSDLRIRGPVVREGFLRDREKSRQGRGRERFVSVSWDQALGLVGAEIRRVQTNFGNTSIYGGSYGWASAGRLHHAPSALKRFLGLNGGYVDKLGNHSFGAALHIMPYVIGRSDISHQAMAWPLIIEHTRLMVMFGGAHPKNAQIDSGGTALHETANWFAKARAAKIEIANVSPSRDDAPEYLNSEWIGLRPNTDVALMLGLAHTLVQENLHDRKFLDSYCVGFPAFESYLLGTTDGQPKSAEWAAGITGVAGERVRRLARRMAQNRTLITCSWSVQRGDHGEQPIWMAVVLAAMLGQIGKPGGGFSIGLGSVAGIAGSLFGNIPRPTLPLGVNSVSEHVPVGRISDMLLNPGAELAYNGRTIRFPDIRLIYSAGGNPFHHNANLNRFLQAWQKPEVVIVHEPWWGPAAKFADIVLPATTTLERNDIQASELSRFYIAMHKVIEPVGQSRNDFDIFAELADRLGFGEAYTENRTEMEWLRHIYNVARQTAEERGYSLPNFDLFWELGSYEFPEPTILEPFLGAFRRDPIANKLATPSGKIEIFSEKIASFSYADCPPHPCWLEPVEWLGSNKTARFPIHLLSNQPATRLHSQHDASELSQQAKIAGREPLRINAQDAATRQIKDGDTVRVFNDRGAFISAVKIDSSLRENVAQIATGAWYDPESPGIPGSLERHGNPNVVTFDKGTSQLGQSPIAQTTLVQIERCLVPPPVGAFDIPTIIEVSEQF